MKIYKDIQVNLVDLIDWAWTKKKSGIWWGKKNFEKDVAVEVYENGDVRTFYGFHLDGNDVKFYSDCLPNKDTMFTIPNFPFEIDEDSILEKVDCVSLLWNGEENYNSYYNSYYNSSISEILHKEKMKDSDFYPSHFYYVYPNGDKTLIWCSGKML